MRLNGVHNFGNFQTDALGFDDKALDIALQQPLALAGARGGRIGNYRSDARSRFEEAFLDQMLDHFVGRVGVDLQTGRESANRRECLTCLKLAADKGFHSGVDDLIEDGLSGAKLKPERCHIDNVTLKPGAVKHGPGFFAARRCTLADVMHRAFSTALLATLSLAPASAQHRADWMRDAKWGVMNHYLSDWQGRVNHLTMSVEQWNKMIDAFDVEALAKQLASVGAPYYQISIGQNSGYYLSPNKAYEEITGAAPGKCSRRDLTPT